MKTEFTGKRVAVVGLGISNVSLIRFLIAKGAVVTGCDKKSPEELSDKVSALRGLGVQLRLGPDYLSALVGQDYICLTPGMRKDLPEIVEARRAGTVISSEMQLFFAGCKAPVLGVTGSSGKTTTTMLSGQIMAATGRETFVGGNIGQPLIEQAESIPAEAKVVLELSSFQLELLTQSPNIAIVTNVTPNHLDQHASMEEYVQAKKRIISFQKAGDYAVLNYDDPTTRAMASECHGSVAYFSRRELLPEGAYVEDGYITLAWQRRKARICHTSELKLLGEHNIENVLAAAMATFLFGAQLEAIRRVVIEFRGAPHRLEFVREVGGVRYYNDSIATTPARAIAGLESFSAPITLIAGGYDKKLPFEEFAALVVRRVRTLILLGVTAAKIRAAVESAALRENVPVPSIVAADSLMAAVHHAAAHARPGEVVLLSPACASYDMFRNFEERGQMFRDLVRSI